MKLIACTPSDLKDVDSTHGAHRVRGSRTAGVQPEEPIHVQVRIHQYGSALPEIRQIRAGALNQGQLPIGGSLDCYV